jgi:tetratricopeptide (TPR) repeat protein
MTKKIEDLVFLIVDDYGDMRGVLRNMLQSFGATRIDSVANAKDAIAAIENKRFDVILCDYNLGPGKDGQQILEEIRERRLIGAGTIFVMVTAENTRIMVMGAVEYEPDSYLTKPFTKDLLGQRLERLLNRKADLLGIERAIENKDYDLAHKLLDEKIAQKPRNITEFIKLKGELCLKTESYDQAEEIYQGVLRNREIVWAQMGLGKTYFGKEQFSEAQNLFKKMVGDNERLMAAYDWLAKTHQVMDEPEKAQKVLEKATVLSGKAVIRHKALGELAMKNGDDKVADKAFNQAIKMGKYSIYKHPSIYANLAKTKSRMGNPLIGMKVLTDLKKEFKGEREADLYSAMTETVLHKDMGNEEQAKRSMEQANQLFEELGNRASPEIAMNMAQACHSVGDNDKAKELLQQAIRNNHSDEAFLKNVGNLMGELGLEKNPEVFVTDIKKGIIRLNNKGVELAKNGKLKEACELFEEAAEGMPGNKVVNLNAARIFMMEMSKGEIDPRRLGKVREYLDRVRRLEPENQTLRKMDTMYQNLINR